MKPEDLFIEASGSEFLEHSERAVKPIRKSIFIKSLGLAARLCVIITAVLLKPHFNPSPQSPSNGDTSHRWIITYNKAAAMRDALNAKKTFVYLLKSLIKRNCLP